MAATSVRKAATKRVASPPGCMVATARARLSCAVQTSVSSDSTPCTASQSGAQIPVSTSAAAAPR
jgi:hypothetical protein